MSYGFSPLFFTQKSFHSEPYGLLMHIRYQKEEKLWKHINETKTNEYEYECISHIVALSLLSKSYSKKQEVINIMSTRRGKTALG